MTKPTRFSYKPVGHAVPALKSRVVELCDKLELLPPNQLAERSGASYLELGQSRGEFHLELLGTSIVVTYPDFHAINLNSASPLPVFIHALVLYYFLHSDGTLPTGKWISFANLPEGRIYSSAFQGYTGNELVTNFGMNMDGFCAACENAGGNSVIFGDASYCFQAFPRMNLLVVYNLGDDDFPSVCKLLFDGNAGHYLPTEAFAILGSLLTQKILKAVRR